MKILFLTDNFFPENNAPAVRTFEHCKVWSSEGAEVTVLTCFPNFPRGKVFKGYKNKLYEIEYIEQIRIIRVWTYIAENKDFLKRTIDYLSFGLSSFFAALFVKTDVIIATSPQFFTATSGHLLSKIKRRPWIMEVRDLWPDSIVAVGSIKKHSRIFKVLKKIEICLYKSADKIVVVTDSFKKIISSSGIKTSKIIVIYNGFTKSASTEKEFKIKEKLNGKFVVSYIGTIGLAHKIDFIVKCIKSVEKTTHFLFVGDGANKKSVQKLTEELNLENVTFHESVDRSFIINFLKITDVALVNLKKSVDFSNVIPSKIFENVAHNIPILLGLEGEAKKLIEKYNIGVTFEPENKSSFLNALDKIKSFKRDTEYKKRCLNFIKKFDRKKLALKMYDVILNEVNKNGKSLNNKN